MPAQVTPGARPPSHAPVDRASLVFLTVSALVIVSAWSVATRVWDVAGQAAPIIGQFVLENGGPLSATEWNQHEEAQHVFSHSASLDVTERSALPIEGVVLYSPSLMLKTFVSVAGLIVVGISGIALPRRWAAALFAVTVTSGVALIAPLIIFSDTITAVTDIVE